MATRRPARNPYCEVFTQGRWSPALILCWIHGRKGEPDAWSALVVINSINDPGHAVELVVAANDIRAVTACSQHAPAEDD